MKNQINANVVNDKGGIFVDAAIQFSFKMYTKFVLKICFSNVSSKFLSRYS